MDEAEQFLPLYLRFIKGVIDSNDLPLNVSREILQQDEKVVSIRNALTKRALTMMESMGKKDSEKYLPLQSPLERGGLGEAHLDKIPAKQQQQLDFSHGPARACPPAPPPRTSRRGRDQSTPVAWGKRRPRTRVLVHPQLPGESGRHRQ